MKHGDTVVVRASRRIGRIVEILTTDPQRYRLLGMHETFTADELKPTLVPSVPETMEQAVAQLREHRERAKVADEAAERARDLADGLEVVASEARSCVRDAEAQVMLLARGAS